MAGGPGLEPVWRSGPGDPDYAASVRKRVAYTASNVYTLERPGSPARKIVGTKPYEFIGFGAMDVTKTYKFIGFGAMDVTKPCKFIGFGDIPGP